MKTFLIKLEPLEPFFFGTEKMAETGNRNNYFQKSAFYPQQTAVLGMLRFLIGKINNEKRNLLADKQFDAEWIGNKSFDVSNNSLADFGYIHSISPVFVVRDHENYFDAPFDNDFIVDFRPNQSLNFNENKKQFTPIVTGYNANDGLNYNLISKAKKTIPLNYDKDEAVDGVFWTKTKDGNEKHKDGAAKDSGYYKFEYVRMNNACFGFYATFCDDAGISESQTEFVFLGGDKSTFKLTFEKTVSDEYAWKEYLSQIPTSNYSKIVLLSDTYLEPSAISSADFSITELVSFRNLKTSSSTTHWSRLNRDRTDNTKPQFSEKFNLLKKGSVLYFLNATDCENVVKQIDSYRNFQQIGYNQYIVIS